MTTVVTRASKGSALTWTEADANISNLNTDKLEDITNESIGDLSDVDISSNTNGYVLTYNSTSGNLELQQVPASTGYTGSQGDVGYTGSAGADGATGYTGSQGDAGATGATGYTGSQGDAGSAGATGYTGSQGDAGSAGATGYTGSQGDAGSAGATGYTGSQGDQGLQGLRGYTGSQGDAGSTGATGYTGSAGLSELSVDTTPQLGGNLDGQAYDVSDIELINYKETVYTLSYAATITPDVANGNVQKMTCTGNFTFSAFSNPEAGQSMTLIVIHNGAARTMTSTMLFAGGDDALSTSDTTDIMSVFYDGTNYYASIAKGFA